MGELSAEIEAVLSGRARWHVEHGDCLQLLPQMERDCFDLIITDPPYSSHTHAKQWIGAALTEDGKPRVSTAHKELGFDPITPEQIAALAVQFARVARRWCLVFSDIEGAPLWRDAGVAAGLDYVRTCIWDKVDSAPQFTGDRPAAAAEAIVCLHRPGRKRWNGGGRRNVFRHEVNGARGPKPHPSTKPLPLMIELVDLFSDPGELIADPFCGSGSTGVACMRRARRFSGLELQEQWVAVANDRLRAEQTDTTLDALRVGQQALFGGIP